MSFGRAYTTNERALIARNQRHRVPLRETARIVGRTYTAVRNYCSDNGLLQSGRRRWSEDDDRALLQYAREGLTAPEIAARMRSTPASVRHRLLRLNTNLGRLRSGESAASAAQQPTHSR